MQSCREKLRPRVDAQVGPVVGGSVFDSSVCSRKQASTFSHDFILNYFCFKGTHGGSWFLKDYLKILHSAVFPWNI